MAEYRMTSIDIGGYLIESYFVEDNRGCFLKLYEDETFFSHGILFRCNETFLSRSERNVVRGIHFQTRNPQMKLISVLSGKIFDVIVDLRKESSTYGQWRGFYLSVENHRSLLVPRGFGHGFLSLTGGSEVLYQCDGHYDKESDTGIRFDDNDIAIEWPTNKAEIITGKRDRSLMTFREFTANYGFAYEKGADIAHNALALDERNS